MYRQPSKVTVRAEKIVAIGYDSDAQNRCDIGIENITSSKSFDCKTVHDRTLQKQEALRFAHNMIDFFGPRWVPL
jgi:hypothetical protein